MMPLKIQIPAKMEGIITRLHAMAGRLRKPAVDDSKYDRQTVAIMERVLGQASNCIDIGASNGELLKHMVRLAPCGTHLAFEPLPHFYAALVKRFSTVRVYKLALSDSAAESASFRHVVTNPAYSGLRHRRYDRPRERVEEILVRTARLDDLVPQGVPVHFIKIDVEGGEFHVLKGALETVRRSRPFIVFEFGMGGADWYGIQPEDMYRMLAGCGLEVSLIPEWLAAGTSLGELEFAAEFREYRSYCFLAHPCS